LPTGSRQLVRQAERFASDLAELLNGTVATGIRISSVLHPTGTCWVARGITKTDLSLRKGVPLRLGRGAARGYLLVAQILELDPEGRHLATTKSQYGLYADEGLEQMVLHYDYERSPAHGYPAAHVQVNGDSPALDELCRRAGVRKELKDLHLPVGGRRFRPTLEDLIEFLVIEGFADARSDWRGVIERHRRAWQERQLRAAVRRHPAAARRELEDLDRR
jgi:hypothetical protein